MYVLSETKGKGRIVKMRVICNQTVYPICNIGVKNNKIGIKITRTLASVILVLSLDLCQLVSNSES